MFSHSTNYSILCCILYLKYSISSQPTYVNIGLVCQHYNDDGAIDVLGSHRAAAMLLAVKEINNKTDNIFNDLLPNTFLKVAVREIRGDDYLMSLDAAKYLALSAFNQSGVVAAIGTGYSDKNKPISQLFSSIPQKTNYIDFSSDSILSRHNNYPYYSRLYASESYDGVILARIIARYFAWTTVNVFSTLDTYGRDTLQEFRYEAEALGIKIENEHSFWPGTTSYLSMLDTSNTKGILKIFVLLMKSGDTGRLLEAGYKSGMFREGTQVLGTRYVASPSTWEVMSPDVSPAVILKGLIGVSPMLDRNTSSFESFVQRYIRQTDTKIIMPDSSIRCSSEKDDDGNNYLYISHGNPSGSVCTGVTFSALRADGSDLVDEAAYAYDSVVTLARSLHQLLVINGQTNFTGDELHSTLVSQPSFTGVTGSIDMFEGYGGSESYGRGDRRSGLTYNILNFNPTFFYRYTDTTAQALRNTGVWVNDEYSFVPCDRDRDATCSHMTYNTATGEKVDGLPIVIIKELDMRIKQYLLSVGIISLLLGVVYLFMMFHYYDSKLVRAGQPSVLLMILLGCLLGSVHIILLSSDITDGICQARMWIGHLSFAVLLIGFVMFSWVFVTSVSSGTSATSLISRYHIYRKIYSGFCIFILFLVINSAAGRPHLSYSSKFEGRLEIRHKMCAYENANVNVLLYVVEALVLFFGAKMCWDMKHGHEAHGEWSHMALALYVIVFVCAVIFPMTSLSFDRTPQNLTAAIGTGFFFAVFSVLNILYAPRAIQTFSISDRLRFLQKDLIPLKLWFNHGAEGRLDIVRSRATGAQASHHPLSGEDQLPCGKGERLESKASWVDRKNSLRRQGQDDFMRARNRNSSRVANPISPDVTPPLPTKEKQQQHQIVSQLHVSPSVGGSGKYEMKVEEAKEESQQHLASSHNPFPEDTVKIVRAEEKALSQENVVNDSKEEEEKTAQNDGQEREVRQILTGEETQSERNEKQIGNADAGNISLVPFETTAVTNPDTTDMIHVTEENIVIEKKRQTEKDQEEGKSDECLSEDIILTCEPMSREKEHEKENEEIERGRQLEQPEKDKKENQESRIQNSHNNEEDTKEKVSDEKKENDGVIISEESKHLNNRESKENDIVIAIDGEEQIEASSRQECEAKGVS